MLRAVKYILVLGILLAAAAAVAGVVAARRYGDGAYAASAVSAALVWVVGSLSLLIVASATSPQARLNAALLGMLVRMALPMAALLYFTNSTQPLAVQAASQGIVPLLVVHYLFGLVVETLLSVRLVAAVNPPKLAAIPAQS